MPGATTPAQFPRTETEIAAANGGNRTWRGDAPAAPALPPPATPPPQQQTEAVYPLSGATSTQPQDTTSQLPNDARQAGFSQRGQGVPRGTDAADGMTVGGTGLYARRFASPQAANIYHEYTKRLFGDPQIA